MHTEIIVDSHRGNLRVALVENGKLVELFLDTEKERQRVGDIFRGRVDSILPGLQSSFIDIGLERKAYLHIDDIITTGFEDLENEFAGDADLTDAVESRLNAEIQDLLRPGQEIIVQIQKEAIGEKSAKLTTNISIPGRYLVLMPFQNKVFVSNRITDLTNRRRLANLVEGTKPARIGAIVRTAAELAVEEEIEGELRDLIALWEKLLAKSKRERAPYLLYKEKGLMERVLRDIFSEETNVVIVDSVELYESAQNIIKSITPGLASRVRLYEDDAPVFKAFGIEDEIERIFRRKIWLRSGGYIVIEETEALTAIDVNTGRFLGREDMAATLFKTNIEAAIEIARQVRLRNIGGLIIIDFIDMTDSANRRQVLDQLKESLIGDRARSKILELSALGLVEMTRQRTRESVTSILTRDCPYCRGLGYVFTLEAMAERIEREISNVFLTKPDRDLMVIINPQVKEYLDKAFLDTIIYLEKEHRARITLEARLDMPLDELEIINIPGTRYTG